MKIENSLHKYYNAAISDLKQPVNYNDFSFLDFQKVSEDLAYNIFDRPQGDFKLSTNFETGLNIQLDDHAPFDVISRYMSCVTTTINEFFTCQRYKLKGKPIERLCCMSDYSLKFYDKSVQANLNDSSILRYEAVFVQLRKIRKVINFQFRDDITLANLNSKDIWHKLFEYLIQMYDSIKKLPMITHTLPLDIINDIHGYCSKMFADDIKMSMNTHQYKAKRKAMEQVYKKYNISADNYHQTVKTKLIEKYNSLIY